LRATQPPYLAQPSASVQIARNRLHAIKVNTCNKLCIVISNKKTKQQMAESASAAPASLQNAERLQSENEELRKRLEVLELKARIAELEKNDMLMRTPESTPRASVSSAISPIPASKKSDHPFSDLDPDIFATSSTDVRSVNNVPTAVSAPATIAGLDSDSAAAITDARTAPTPSTNITQNCYIECPSYKVNMYQDIKFDEDPFAVGMGLNLKGIISKTEYRKAMQSVNQMLKKCRTPTGATATLLMSPMIPFLLIPWAIGNKKRKTKRSEKLQSATEWFNAEHPGLFMKFETRPRKRLIIMRRDDARRLEVDE